MKKKKSIRLLTVIIAISLVFTSAFTASAAKADIEKVGGIPTRFVTGFENLGGTTVDSSDALFGSGASTGVDFGVKSGYGVNGSNAYVFGNNSADNFFAEASYNPNFDDAAKTEGLENATDMVFYVNGEGETDELAFMIVFGEWDYDSDGNPVMKRNNETGNMENAVTFWKVADDINTTYYSLADGETEWEKHTGTSNAYVRLPAGFKGYVRVPLDNFDPDWNSRDENDKKDLIHLNVAETPLIPADFERLKSQLAAVSPYVDNILAFIFEGLFSNPNSIAYTGYDKAAKYYNEYVNWLKSTHPEMIKE